MTVEQTAHILNGLEMYKYFKKNRSHEQGVLIPFNEAMCYGETCADLFSQEFIALRSNVHHVTQAHYTELTIEPLRSIFSGEISSIQLWFDSDMFCQINLLTVLAGLDQIRYPGNATLCLVDDHFNCMEQIKLSVGGYKTLYDQVLIRKESPPSIEPTPLKKGVELYLNYLKPDSDLMLFIRKHRHVPEQHLIALLLKNFKPYGLGDTQYAELIKMNRDG